MRTRQLSVSRMRLKAVLVSGTSTKSRKTAEMCLLLLSFSCIFTVRLSVGQDVSSRFGSEPIGQNEIHNNILGSGSLKSLSSISGRRLLSLTDESPLTRLYRKRIELHKRINSASAEVPVKATKVAVEASASSGAEQQDRTSQPLITTIELKARPASTMYRKKQAAQESEGEDGEGFAQKEEPVAEESAEESSVPKERYVKEEDQVDIKDAEDLSKQAAGDTVQEDSTPNVKSAEMAESGSVDEGLSESWSSLDDLKKFSAFDIEHPVVRQFAAMVEKSLTPWSKLHGVKSGLGSKGMIPAEMLAIEGTLPNLMSCSGHVKVVKGVVYFRYGGFVGTWYRLRRFHQTIKMIQDAIDKYGLEDISAEFLLNTCDLPMSSDSSETNIRSGYPIFSTEHTPGSIDILFPDPLDLAEGYMPNTENQVPWEEKKAKAVFRGASTNYNLQPEGNWRANPRFRLHRMSDLRPDLIDARIMRWSHAMADTITKIEEDGFKLGGRMTQQEKSAFKYEIVVDGGVGSCRTCGVLASNQAVIRQASVYTEFFEPMLKAGVHYMPTEHHFGDLFKRVEWAQANDEKVKKMVKKANEVAKWACTWEGRTLYWAILLVKYSKNALESPESVVAPKSLCGGRPQKSILKLHTFSKTGAVEVPSDWPPLCSKVAPGPNFDKSSQPPCTFFCIHGRIPEEKWIWLSSEGFSDVPRLGPHQ